MPPSSTVDHVRDTPPFKHIPRMSIGKIQPAIPFALSRSASKKKPNENTSEGRKEQVKEVQKGGHDASKGNQVDTRKDKSTGLSESNLSADATSDNSAEQRSSAGIASALARDSIAESTEAPMPQPHVTADGEDVVQSSNTIENVQSFHHSSTTPIPLTQQRHRRFESSPLSSNVHFSTRLHPHRLSGSQIIFGESELPAATTLVHSTEETPLGTRPFQPSQPQPTSNDEQEWKSGLDVPVHFAPKVIKPAHAHQDSISTFSPQPTSKVSNGLNHTISHHERVPSNGAAYGETSGIGHSRSNSYNISAPLYLPEQSHPSFLPPDVYRANGMSHRHSQSAPFPRMNTDVQPPSLFNQIDLNIRLQNAESLRDHVLGSFGEQAFSDCRLDVIEEVAGIRHQLDGHGLILSRSPTLARLIQPLNIAGDFRGGFRAEIRLPGTMLRFDIFIDALRYMYGGPLPMLDPPHVSIHGPNGSLTNEARMRIAFRFIAMGHWLGIGTFGAHGVDLATSVLHWDTIGIALAFALDGGLDQMWTNDDGEDATSPSSSDGSYSHPEMSSHPTYDPFATDFLHRIIAFIVHLFPPNFYLDTAAPILVEVAGSQSPNPADVNLQSRFDPRLTKIRFGDASTESHQRPSIVTTVVSSVLLSLPFPILKCVLEHVELAYRLGPDTVSSVMRQVIAERETRRTRIIKTRTAGYGNEAGVSNTILNWREFVEPSQRHRAGSRLVRRRRETSTPVSSGTASEWS